METWSFPSATLTSTATSLSRNGLIERPFGYSQFLKFPACKKHPLARNLKFVDFKALASGAAGFGCIDKRFILLHLPIFGLPVSGLLGYKFNTGVYGIWSRVLLGCFMQTLLLCLVARTNWQKESLKAQACMETWGGTPNK